MSRLSELRGNLFSLFADHPYRIAHEKAQSLLKPLAGDQELFEELILEAVRKPDFFKQKRINPVIAFDLAKNPDCHLIAHCWLPRPDGNTDISHQSIHHHGNLLLTSLSAFGPGYESVLFRAGFEIDSNTLQTRMQLEKIYKNPQGNIEFVDIDTPHIVFYPEKLSVTYALWSNDKKVATQKLKRLPLLQKYKSILKPLLYKIGLDKALHVNTIKFLDFYVEDGKVIVMPERVRYPDGSNENFLRAFFHLLQSMNFKKIAELERAMIANSDAQMAIPYLKDLMHGKPIPNTFEEIHLQIPKVTIPRSAIYQCFPELQKQSKSG